MMELPPPPRLHYSFCCWHELTKDPLMKRLFDICAALLGLVLSLPLVAVAALAIRRESPGPAIFRQKRIGRWAREFTCYKLRTMYAGTADLPTHEAKVSAVTPLGHRLRKWKVDELPQLFNVLLGQMSLVGPRPCLPMQNLLIEARASRGVFAVRPGITGLAQVRGIDMSEPARLAAVDAEYVGSASFVGDLKLVLATVFGRGVGVDRIAPRQPKE